MTPVVAFLGAGISLPAPSGLPLFADLRDEVISAAGLRGDIDWDVLTGLAPERLFSIVTGLPEDKDRVTAWLRSILMGMTPNTNHWVAADIIEHGGAVWTPNFDTLIEDACSDHDGRTVQYHVASWPEEPTEPECRCGRGHLYKAHGTITGELIFSSEQVLGGLSDGWTERLKASLDGASVVVAGYQGADLDIGPVLRAGLNEAHDVTWFEFGGALPTLRSRFPDLDHDSFVEANPSEGLYEYYLGRRSGLLAPPPALDRGPVRVPQLGLLSHNASGRLSAQLIGRTAARRHFRSGILTGAGRDRAECLNRLAESVLYEPGRWWAVCNVVTAVASRTLVLRTRQTLMRARLTFLEGGADSDRVRSEGQMMLLRAPEDHEIRLRLATANKLLGHIDESISGARHVRSCRERGAEVKPSHVGWSTFTLAFSLRWAGEYDEAAKLAEELVTHYAAHGGPVWKAWGLFERACIRTLTGVDGAAADLEVAILILEQLGNDAARYDCLTSQVTIARGNGAVDGAMTKLDQIEQGFRNLGVYSDYRLSAVELERAEVHLAHGSWAQAVSRADAAAALSPSAHVQALAKTVAARSLIASGNNSEHALRDAERIAEAIGFPFVLGLCRLVRAAREGHDLKVSLENAPGVTSDVEREFLRLVDSGWDPISQPVVFP